MSTDISYESWMALVDDEIGRLTGGLSHRDLADQLWYDWYQSEMDPVEAAEACLEDEGFPFEED
jgi:hypothetical protein